MQRSLALMAATGGDPAAGPPGRARQRRRARHAPAPRSGSASGWSSRGCCLPVVQRFSDAFLGPYDVPWLHLVGIAGFGLLSALLAAVVPAWIASRQDVVAVLAGRRGDRRPSLRSPLLGLRAARPSASGSRRRRRPAGGASSSSRSRDRGRARHDPAGAGGRGRRSPGSRAACRCRCATPCATRPATAPAPCPAVAAVAATVAGVVALGIAQRQRRGRERGDVRAALPTGPGIAARPTGADPTGTPTEAVAERYAARRRGHPGQRASPTTAGAAPRSSFRVDGEPLPARLLRLLARHQRARRRDDGRCRRSSIGLDDAERARPRPRSRPGGVVVFANRGVDADEATVVVRELRPASTRRTPARGHGARPRRSRSACSTASFQGVLSAAAAERLGIEPATVGLLVDGVADHRGQQEHDVSEALAAIVADAVASTSSAATRPTTRR